MSTSPTQTDSYVTKDTGLAAYLITEGYDMFDLDNSVPGRATFHFHNTSTALDKAVKAYQTLKATTNAHLYFINYKKLLREIKERKNESKAV